MSLDEFVQELREEYAEELREFEELDRILEQLKEKEDKVYNFFVTSNL